jgi:predicted metal-dependent peptidase
MASWDRSKPISRLETSWNAWNFTLTTSAVDIANDMIHYAKAIGLGDAFLTPVKPPNLVGKAEAFSHFQEAELVDSSIDPSKLKLEDYYLQIRSLFEDNPNEVINSLLNSMNSLSGIPLEQEGSEEDSDNSDETQDALDKLLSPDNLGSDVQAIEESWQDVLSALINKGEEEAKRKNAGIGNGSLSHLFKKIEKAKTPWHVYLASFIQTCFNDEKISDWSRPSRRTMANHNQFFLPHEKPEGDKVPYLTICMDTSGSCWHERTLTLFAKNLITLANKLASVIEFIEFDDGVLSRSVLDEPTPEDLQKLLKDNGVSGGGGTSFDETIKYLEGTALDVNDEMRPHAPLPTVCIFLTDGYADFPDKSKFPIIWMLDGSQNKHIEETCNDKTKRWMLVDAGERDD